MHTPFNVALPNLMR